MNLKGMTIHGPSVGIGCVLGLGAGIAGGFGLYRLVLLPKLQGDFNSKVDDRVNEESAALRAHYESRYNQRLKEALAGVVTGAVGTDGSTDEGQTAVGASDRKPEHRPAVNYAAITPATGPPREDDPRLEGVDPPVDDDDPDSADPADSGGEEVRNVFADHPEGDFPKIRRVNRDEMGELPPRYQTQVLSWYAGDGVLCDESDDPIRTPVLLIGTDRPQFGYLEEDPHVYLVVNEELDLAIEVIYKEGSFIDVLRGTYGGPIEKQREEPA